MLVGYARVSTFEQTLDLQQDVANSFRTPSVVASWSVLDCTTPFSICARATLSSSGGWIGSAARSSTSLRPSLPYTSAALASEV
jgi:hypothetical protein